MQRCARRYMMHWGKQSEKPSLSSRRKEAVNTEIKTNITFHRSLSFFYHQPHLRNPQDFLRPRIVHIRGTVFLLTPLTRSLKGTSHYLNCPPSPSLNPRLWSQSPSGINDSKSMVAEHCPGLLVMRRSAHLVVRRFPP